jgi:hypothetical protein
VDLSPTPLPRKASTEEWFAQIVNASGVANLHITQYSRSLSMKTEPTRHPDGSFEWDCRICGEALLFYKGDEIVVSVGDNGEVIGVVCDRCSNSEKQEPTDG